MRISIARKRAADLAADMIVIPVAKGSETGGAARELAPGVRAALADRIEKTGFEAKPAATLTLQSDGADIVLVGMGDSQDAETWRRAAARARSAAGGIKAETIAICVGSGRAASKHVGPVVEGFLLADYRFEKYKSRDEDAYDGPSSLIVAGASLPPSASAAVKRSRSASEAVCSARDLINEMSTVKTPSYLAKTARAIAREGGLSCTVWQGKKLESERMNGILAVSAGSAEPGAFIKLVYKPKRKAKAVVAVIGKGITFDSGGLSLKPAKSMEAMKQDMSGAAAVLGLMKAVAEIAPAVEVRGYVASAENMPGGRAQKPGDVITFRNGTSAEVLNTDAEGRLVLADALCVACEEKPDVMVDLATLTGACMVALGTRIAGIMGNDQGFVNALIKHGEQAGEKIWQLPLPDEYKEDIKSSVADIQNIGSSYGGTITAGLFLAAFVSDTKWAHIDIAGPAFAEKPMPYRPRGGTGFGIMTLLSYLDSF